MDSSVSSLSRNVTTLVTRDGILDANPVVFSYDRRDPFAVTLNVASGETKVEWVFSRDLLKDGLTMVVGEGDLLIYPDEGAVVIEMYTADSELRLECARRGVQSFVAGMYEAVPEESVSVSDELDRVLEEILG